MGEPRTTHTEIPGPIERGRGRRCRRWLGGVDGRAAVDGLVAVMGHPGSVPVRRGRDAGHWIGVDCGGGQERCLDVWQPLHFVPETKTCERLANSLIARRRRKFLRAF